jgi:hypothetical protein
MEPRELSEAKFWSSASEGRTDVLKKLLAAGVFVDCIGPSGETALMIAAQADQVETVRWLVGKGASVDARDERGTTALIFAAALGKQQTVMTLLELGADPAAKNHRGQDSLVMATVGDHAVIADLLRDRILERRSQVAREQAEKIGVEFSELPPEKIGFFISGHTRDEHETIDRSQDVLTSEDRIGEEMERTIPLTTFDGWLKQVSMDMLNPLGRLALDRAFPLFLTFMDFSEDLAHNLLTRRGGGVKTFHRPMRTRRFAGDDRLPRGRYFSLCRDQDGNDRGTLKGELWAYYRASDAGLIDILDYSLEGAIHSFEKGYGISFPEVKGPALALLFLQGKQISNPFLSLLGLDGSKPLIVVIPVQTVHSRIERTLDLRSPVVAQWFAHFFSRLTIKANDEKWMRCWPFRPGLASFHQILPTLLTQERGGGAFSLAVGSWLRQHGVNALIYPSARSDCGVEIHDGTVTAAKGWNLVDYRDASPPHIQKFLDISDYWEEDVRTGIGLGVGNLPETDPYQAVRIDYATDERHRGSWSVAGIVAVKQALLANELEKYATAVTEGVARPGLSWVGDLPVAKDVQKWVAAFVSGEFKKCAEWGVSLLPHIASFEILQMFLMSLHRLGKQPAAGGWNADEILQQLAPQLICHHRHDPELQSLLSITLGLREPNEVIELAADETHRARAQYYGSARLLGKGRRDEALPYLDACVRSGVNALETHLALAESAREHSI